MFSAAKKLQKNDASDFNPEQQQEETLTNISFKIIYSTIESLYFDHQY